MRERAIMWIRRIAFSGVLLGLVMPAPAITTQAAIPVTTIERASNDYDAGSVRGGSDNAFGASKASQPTEPPFGQVAGLVAAKSTPDFIVTKGGTAYPVPKGATGPIPAESGKGFQFTGGSGGHGLSPRTTDVRIMDPVTSGKYQYPGGYGSYGNAAGQTVNPLTGQTIPKSDPWWHIPAEGGQP